MVTMGPIEMMQTERISSEDRQMTPGMILLGKRQWTELIKNTTVRKSWVVFSAEDFPGNCTKNLLTQNVFKSKQELEICAVDRAFWKRYRCARNNPQVFYVCGIKNPTRNSFQETASERSIKACIANVNDTE